MKALSFCYGVLVAIIFWVAIMLVLSTPDFMLSHGASQTIVNLMIVPVGIIFIIFANSFFKIADNFLAKVLIKKNIEACRVTSDQVFFGFITGLFSIGLVLSQIF